MTIIKLGFALGVLAVSTAAAAQSTPNGQQAFGTCVACHGVKPNDKRMGPTLFGVVGRKAAAIPGFSYSTAMTNSKIVWTKAKLDVFLKAPMKLVPGTKMPVPGIADDAKRAALIEYLATLK